MSKKYVAVDLGASNGRVIVGDLNSFDVVHRFVTTNDMVIGEFYWDIVAIFREIKIGLKEAFRKYGSQIQSIGFDTWGVDHGLLDANGSLVSMPYHYRDARTDGMIETVALEVGGKDYIFDRTGIAFQPYNTIYQLAAMKKYRPQTFKAARHYLSIPDLLCYWLTGNMVNERTHASTTQLYNPNTRDWDDELIEKLGFDRKLFGKIVDPGYVVGTLTEDLVHELEAPEGVKVVAAAAHDTASAVAAVPCQEGENALYLSSGTWSLLGVELKKPRTDMAARDSGFTNETAANGNIRFLKNIMGMWIQQECVRYWESIGEPISWKELDELTIKEADYDGYIDPTDVRFLKPNGFNWLMTDRIADYCAEHGFARPANKGQYMVAIYRGLAKTYCQAIEDLKEMLGIDFNTLYIIGGGCKNEILDKWTAEECKIDVSAGPVEATALGNIMVQMLASGEISSLQEGRNVLREAQQVKVFHP